MNKRKIIFFVILGILLGFFVLLILSLNSGKQETASKKRAGDLNIWLYQDDKEDFLEFITTFKNSVPGMKNITVEVESFSNYEDYYLTLTSAFLEGNGPDIFMLNNNETSILEKQVSGIDSEIIPVSDFRQKYASVFDTDLVVSFDTEEGVQEVLKGVPVGYQTLGIFYNRKFISNASKISSWTGINTVIGELESKNITPIALGNGSTVENAFDIITQFFLLDKVTSLAEAIGSAPKGAFGSYFSYGDNQGDNAYDQHFYDLNIKGKNNLDLFSQSEVAMVAGYPSMLKDIDDKGFRKNFLSAVPFPQHYVGGGYGLVHYNFFALNKNTVSPDSAKALLKFLTTEEGATAYLDIVGYKLPALVNLADDFINTDKKIHPDYNIYYKNFIDTNTELSSFDKGIKFIYDREIEKILDDSINYLGSFELLKDSILCKSRKASSLTNLSESCR